MRKRVSVLTIIIALLLTVTTAAVTSRGVIVTPTLSYDGTTAVCEVVAAGNTENETIFATIRLMHGDEMIRTWYPSARGILDFTETVEVTRGETYTLTVWVITSTAGNLPEVSVSGRCE